MGGLGCGDGVGWASESKAQDMKGMPRRYVLSSFIFFVLGKISKCMILKVFVLQKYFLWSVYVNDFVYYLLWYCYFTCGGLLHVWMQLKGTVSRQKLQLWATDSFLNLIVVRPMDWAFVRYSISDSPIVYYYSLVRSPFARKNIIHDNRSSKVYFKMFYFGVC